LPVFRSTRILRQVVLACLLHSVSIRRAALLVVAVTFLAACGGAEEDAANTSAAPSTAPHAESIVIHEELIIAATEHSEPIATGTVLARSKLGASLFCAGGTIRDTHANLDPKMKPYLIDRKITCADGTVRMGLTPEIGAGPQDPTQKGSWTIVGGTGAFERLRGSGKSVTAYGQSPSAPAQETLTGTVRR
jgi:hypothetical protein